MLATREETIAVLSDIKTWDLVAEVDELIEKDHEEDTEGAFDDFEKREFANFGDIAGALNMIAAMKYDETYGGSALDDEGGAWFRGAMLSLRTLDCVASHKSVSPKKYRKVLMRSQIFQVMSLETDPTEETIKDFLGIIDDIGSTVRARDGYGQIAAGVGVNLFSEMHEYNAFLNGYSFLIDQGRKAIAGAWIAHECKRGLALLMASQET